MLLPLAGFIWGVSKYDHFTSQYTKCYDLLMNYSTQVIGLCSGAMIGYQYLNSRALPPIWKIVFALPPLLAIFALYGLIDFKIWAPSPFFAGYIYIYIYRCTMFLSLVFGMKMIGIYPMWFLRMMSAWGLYLFINGCVAQMSILFMAQEISKKKRIIQSYESLGQQQLDKHKQMTDQQNIRLLNPKI